MHIRIRLFSMLRLKFGVAELELETERPLSMRELIDRVDERIGPGLTEQLLAEGVIRKGTLLLLGGRNVLLMSGLDTAVDGSREVSFFPPSGGG